MEAELAVRSAGPPASSQADGLVEVDIHAREARYLLERGHARAPPAAPHITRGHLCIKGRFGFQHVQPRSDGD